MPPPSRGVTIGAMSRFRPSPLTARSPKTLPFVAYGYCALDSGGLCAIVDLSTAESQVRLFREEEQVAVDVSGWGATRARCFGRILAMWDDEGRYLLANLRKGGVRLEGRFCG